MSTCRRCQQALEPKYDFCPRCGTAATLTPAPDAEATAAARPPTFSTLSTAHTPTPPSTASRFDPGHVLADRYRLVGPLGRGGMGEVYRADDLKLGEPVALKFLPRPLGSSPDALARLHDEVRITRQITHPNVCRVYDIVEADGELFIAMECIEGEDLAQLVRRIGRLPHDKAVELAHELCAGLAAAHEKGVLHRDLKPANIMLDGDGRSRITDFGIAVHQDAKQAIAGTPAYMAPEQLAGASATTASDIYSLGLVLYELFTGKPAVAGENLHEIRKVHESGPLPTPSTAFAEIDRVVEKAILRCLEADPSDRPPSALALAAALPGGDPLAAALAAGETPSPDLLAEAGDSGGLAPRWAVTALVGVALLLAFTTYAVQRTYLVNLTEEKLSPDALELRAEEHLEFLGFDPDALEYRAREIRENSRAKNYIFNDLQDDQVENADAWARFAGHGPPMLLMLFRGSPSPQAVKEPGGQIQPHTPPLTTDGMVLMMVDSVGRLHKFLAVPDTLPPPPEIAPPPIDYSALFERTGLVVGEAISSRWTPPIHCDERRAWKAHYADAPEYELVVEVGVNHGRVHRFEIYGPWSTAPGWNRAAWAVVLTLVIGATALLALRNLYVGRGDRQGAMRLAIFMFAVAMLEWLFGADHVGGADQIGMLTSQFAFATGTGAFYWLVYLAIEPFARRYWPHSLVSWTRLLKGRLRDPLVGRDILLGVLLGLTLVAGTYAQTLVSQWGFALRVPDFGGEGHSFLGGRYAIAPFFSALREGPQLFGVFLLMLVLRIILRRAWLAYAATAIGVSTLFLLGGGISALVSGVVVIATLMTCLRIGLLALAAFALVGASTTFYPMTLDSSQWYFEVGLLAPGVILLAALYGFWLSLAGKPVFRDEL